MWFGWVIVAFVGLLFVALSRRLDRAWVTAPMVFVAMGVIVAQDGFALVTVQLQSGVVVVIFKATLALLLFTEAASLKPAELRPEAGPIARLLVIAMPLAIALGTGAALASFGLLSFWEGAIVGAVLAPTDAALSQAVVSNERVPVRVRRALVAESGLNDGLSVPFALAFTAAALADHGIDTLGDPVIFAVQQIGFGVLVGVGLGWVAGSLVQWSMRAGWAGDDWVAFSPLAAVLLVFSGAEVIGGNEFIAAWVGGLTFGHMVRPVIDHVEEFGLQMSQVLTVVAFFVFGAVLLGPALGEFTWEMIVYGLVSLALVRPIAVAIGMIGSRLPWQTVTFMGWFGPRGIASVILVTLVVSEAALPGDRVIALVMTATVTLSVYLHGLSAVPGASRFADWAERQR